MKKQISLFLSIILALNAGTAPAMAADAEMPADTEAPVFPRVNTYTEGQFADVAPEDWYSGSVGAVYELGLMEGEGNGCFNPNQQITVVQAIAMAARLHRIYSTGSGEFAVSEFWYEPYVGYAIEAGILLDGPDLFAVATRAQFADLLSRALPLEALAPINEIKVNAIPDVKAGDPYADSVYLLYRAGIVTGGDLRGGFYPDSGISRAEAAVIMARMADKTLRQSVTLEYFGPDLPEQKERDDTFFAHSAILGNSLVEGLRMYANMDSLDYFSATSVSVISATKTRDTQLNDGRTGTLVQALCQKQYDKIYIALGINEMYLNVDRFIALYGDMLDQIREAEPEADIYILSILPVTKTRSESNPVRGMDRVNLYNEALYKLAGEKQCYYMNLCPAFQGEDGYLPSGWSSDGVHLYRQHYSLWEHCMRTLYR